ncbi:MAG: hypothetical protein IT307_11970 [Chloroflexi bacterium]|nr:hypothetical protein [Chloroflexota bacterium]
MSGVLTVAIVILGLADASLHLWLVFLFFRGNVFATDLSFQFLLNFLGYLALIVLFLCRRRWLGSRAWLANLTFAVYATGAIVLWVQRNTPNPRGLGYPSKAIEVAIVLLALALTALEWRRGQARLAEGLGEAGGGGQ